MRFAILRPVERLDAHRVARHKEASVLPRDREGVHALELRDRLGALLLDEVQRRLGVGA